MRPEVTVQKWGVCDQLYSYLKDFSGRRKTAASTEQGGGGNNCDKDRQGKKGKREDSKHCRAGKLEFYPVKEYVQGRNATG